MLENKFIKIDDSDLVLLDEASELETIKKSEFYCSNSYVSFSSMSQLSQKIIERDNLRKKIDFYFETLIYDFEFINDEWTLKTNNGEYFKTKILFVHKFIYT